jgi:hypothetical protein
MRSPSRIELVFLVILTNGVEVFTLRCGLTYSLVANMHNYRGELIHVYPWNGIPYTLMSHKSELTYTLGPSVDINKGLQQVSLNRLGR